MEKISQGCWLGVTLFALPEVFLQITVVKLTTPNGHSLLVAHVVTVMKNQKLGQHNVKRQILPGAKRAPVSNELQKIQKKPQEAEEVEGNK